MLNAFRRFLIRLGKMLPFMLCFIVMIVYVESFFALYTQDFLLYNEHITLNTPISFMIANVFEYDMLTIFIATILSVAIQTCIWNKVALLYLVLHLFSCNYIEARELEPTTIYIICTLNIIVAGYLTYKGIKILRK